VPKIKIYTLISLCLVFFLVSSPMLPFLDRELGKMLIMGTAEEEHQPGQDGSKKKLEQNKFLSRSVLRFWGNSRFKNKDPRALHYLFSICEFKMETLDPPPEAMA